MLKSSPFLLCYRSLLRSTLLFTPLKDLAVEKVFAEKIPRSHDHVHCRLWGISSLFRRVVSANFRPLGCRSFYLPIAYTIYPGEGSGLWYYLRPRKGLKTISLAETEFCKEDSFLCIFFFRELRSHIPRRSASETSSRDLAETRSSSTGKMSECSCTVEAEDTHDDSLPSFVRFWMSCN